MKNFRVAVTGSFQHRLLPGEVVLSHRVEDRVAIVRGAAAVSFFEALLGRDVQGASDFQGALARTVARFEVDEAVAEGALREAVEALVACGALTRDEAPARVVEVVPAGTRAGWEAPEVSTFRLRDLLPEDATVQGLTGLAGAVHELGGAMYPDGSNSITCTFISGGGPCP